MLKIKLVVLFLSSLSFLSTPVVAEELSCPAGGAPMQVMYGDVVNCSIESAGDLDVFAISANEGDLISANVSYTGDDDCESLRLNLVGFDENSNQLDNDLAGFCGGTKISFKAAKTRAYTITAADFSGNIYWQISNRISMLSWPMH